VQLCAFHTEGVPSLSSIARLGNHYRHQQTDRPNEPPSFASAFTTKVLIPFARAGRRAFVKGVIQRST
jgi:hypothetical protein